MHVAAVTEIVNTLIPALEELKSALDAKAKAFDHIIKIGRTHLQVSILVTELLNLDTDTDSGPSTGRYSTDTGSGVQRLRDPSLERYRPCQGCASPP